MVLPQSSFRQGVRGTAPTDLNVDSRLASGKRTNFGLKKEFKKHATENICLCDRSAEVVCVCAYLCLQIGRLFLLGREG